MKEKICKMANKARHTFRFLLITELHRVLWTHHKFLKLSKALVFCISSKFLSINVIIIQILRTWHVAYLSGLELVLLGTIKHGWRSFSWHSNRSILKEIRLHSFPLIWFVITIIDTIIIAATTTDINWFIDVNFSLNWLLAVCFLFRFLTYSRLGITRTLFVLI